MINVTERNETMSDEQRWSSLARPTPQWFEDAPLGIFVHWGPYSVPAWAEDHGELGVEEDWEAWFTHNSYAEWYFNTIRIPGSPAALRHKDLYGSASYDAFLDAWDPDAWDPAEWMRLFHRAGAGYAVLTTKHHDGVTLWDAPETGTRNAVRRGPCTDLVAGFANAARDEGLRVGLYYSGGLDWHYRPARPILSEDDCKDLCRPKDADYARYCFVHVRDLIDRYQPDVIWNDIDWPDEGKNFGPYGLGTLFEYFYAKRPEGVTNDRYGGVHADYLTSEYQHMGDSETSGKPWENCRGVGLSFGYNRAESEHQYLSGAAAVRHLVDVVSRGGRLLLNVGPRADGTIPREQRECLEGLGAWNDLYGSELRGVRALPVADIEAVTARSTGDEAWVRLLAHEDHVAVVADASVTQVSGLPSGFDYSRSTILTPGAACSWDGQSLTLQAGVQPPSDARGDALPIVVSAPRA